MFWSLKTNLAVACLLIAGLTGPSAKGQKANEAPDTSLPKPILVAPLVPHTHSFALGAGIGVATMYGDLNIHIPEPGYRIGLGRHITNSLLVGVEYFSGSLSSQESPNGWTAGFTMKSKFYSMGADAKVNMSVFFSNMDGKLVGILSAFYFGSGFGYVSSTTTGFQENRYSNHPNDTIPANALKNHEESYYIPLILGVRIPVHKFLGGDNAQFMINYSECYTNSDFLNGVDLGKINHNLDKRFHNVYSMLTLGVSLSLVRAKSQIKEIRYKPIKKKSADADEEEDDKKAAEPQPAKQPVRKPQPKPKPIIDPEIFK